MSAVNFASDEVIDNLYINFNKKIPKWKLLEYLESIRVQLQGGGVGVRVMDWGELKQRIYAMHQNTYVSEKQLVYKKTQRKKDLYNTQEDIYQATSRPRAQQNAPFRRATASKIGIVPGSMSRDVFTVTAGTVPERKKMKPSAALGIGGNLSLRPFIS